MPAFRRPRCLHPSSRPRGHTRRASIFAVILLYASACDEADVLTVEGGTTDEMADSGSGPASSADGGLSDAGDRDAGSRDIGTADVGASDAGEDTSGATWNPDTCLVEDDGSSRGPGNLEVSSWVLAEDSDPNDRIDDGTTVYYPSIVQTSACRFKVIGWGNGTTGSGGADYPAYFEHLASYGFIVAVAHTNRTLAEGAPILSSIDLTEAEDEVPSSIFFEKLDAGFGLMGKSQGAIAVARDLSDPGAIAGVLIGSGSGPATVLTKPSLFATGDADFLRTLVVQGYEAAAGEAVFVQAMQNPNPQGDPSAGHMDLNDRTGIVELSTSFMRCHLRGNAKACRHIACADCQSEPWSAFETKNIP